MEFYFQQSKIPEFENLDKGQRTEVWAATATRRLQDPFLLIPLAFLVVVVAVCYTLGNLLIPLSYGGVIGGGLGAVLGNLVFSGIATPRARPYLAAEIKSRGW
ncbi:MAG: hypothetical protein GY780_05335 [bacterium]|nr:hypothetical protein [bacterium]